MFGKALHFSRQPPIAQVFSALNRRHNDIRQDIGQPLTSIGRILIKTTRPETGRV